MAARTSNGRCDVPADRANVEEWLKSQNENKSPVVQKFSSIDALFIILSLLTYVFDFVTDFLLVWHYYQHGQAMFGMWTLIFAVIPTLTLQLLSIRWYHSEGTRLCCSWTLVAHFVMLGPVERYISVLRLGWVARKRPNFGNYERLYQTQNDVSILRLIEAFTESAPQLMLQGYFILITPVAITWITGLSVTASLISLSWAVGTYNNNLRLAYRASHKTNWFSLLIQTLWHGFTISARALAIVIFATVFHGWTFLAIGIHWFMMTVWVMIQGPDFFTKHWENKLFSLVLGVVFIFCFMNLKDGPSRSKMWPYYILLLAENGLFVGLWYRERPIIDTLMIVVTSFVFGGFLIGIFLMLIYYRCCHPSGPFYLCRKTKDTTQPEDIEEVHRQRIFDATLASRSAAFSTEGVDLSLDSSWSGLVHSRRGDNPTFTASKYQLSSNDLKPEGNFINNPTVPCNQLFDTPACGGRQGGVSGATIVSISHPNPTWARSVSTSQLNADQVCPTLSSLQSNSRATSHSNISDVRLGCTSLPVSTVSNSKSNSALGLDNPAFSKGSLNTRPKVGQCERVKGCGNYGQVGSASLPSLFPLSSTAFHPQNVDHYKSSQDKSVFAITGTPSSSPYMTPPTEQHSFTHHRLFLKGRQQVKTNRRFELTQSLQCIPMETGASRTLPLPKKESTNKMGTRCDSMSSLSSNIKPRPLSPLNAETLWEESMTRYHQSIVEETLDDIIEPSVISPQSFSSTVQNSSSTPSEDSSSLSQVKDSSMPLKSSSLNHTEGSSQNRSSLSHGNESSTPSLNKSSLIQKESSSKLTPKNSSLLSCNNASSASSQNHSALGNNIGSSVSSQNRSSLSHNSGSSTPSSQNRSSLSYNGGSQNHSSLSNYSGSSVSSSQNRSSLSHNSESLASSQNRSSLSNNSGSSSQNRSLTHNSGSSTSSLNSIKGSSLQKSSSLSRNNASSQNSSSLSHNSGSSLQNSSSVSGYNGSLTPSSQKSSSFSCTKGSSVSSPQNSFSSKPNNSCRSAENNSKITSDHSKVMSSERANCVRSNPPQYDTDSSGFLSTSAEDSMGFFDYSDEARDQSKHTLSDLARQLDMVLNLNNTPEENENRVHFIDTPWRTDYLSRIPTPILHQSLLSLYSASERSLSQGSGLEIAGKSSNSNINGHNNSECFQPKGYTRTPLKIYNLNKSPGSKARFCQSNKRVPQEAISQIPIEPYSSSPYKMLQRVSPQYSDKTSPKQTRIQSAIKDVLIQRTHNLPFKTPKQQTETCCSQKSTSMSSQDSGQKSFSSSTSSAWDEVSDATENIQPNNSSSTPDRKSLSFLESTPDFSPIEKFELPPLTAGSGALKSRQSYFSTPKSLLPGFGSPSLREDQNNTNDSFFGVNVPKFSQRSRERPEYKVSPVCRSKPPHSGTNNPQVNRLSSINGPNSKPFPNFRPVRF